ncbi:MAG: twin-arginine translocase TatA/TatE family subunit [Paludibacteraceae bacterium]|nr:twin-arginine translocase TatA/TatE family subunit [Paludibacteraceae bacterium]
MILMLIVPLFIGTTELLLICGLALLLFGGKKLPEMMRGLGQGVQSFKEGMNSAVNSEEQPGKTQDSSAKNAESENKPDVGEQ